MKIVVSAGWNECMMMDGYSFEFCPLFMHFYYPEIPEYFGSLLNCCSKQSKIYGQNWETTDKNYGQNIIFVCGAKRGNMNHGLALVGLLTTKQVR